MVTKIGQMITNSNSLTTNYLAPQKKILFELLVFPQLLQKFLHYYRVHKSPPPVRILNHIKLVQALRPISTEYILILVLYSYLCLDIPSFLFSSGFPTKTLCTSFSFPKSARYIGLAHYILLCFIIRKMFGEW